MLSCIAVEAICDLPPIVLGQLGQVNSAMDLTSETVYVRS